MTSRPAEAAPTRAEMLASIADASDALFEAGVIRSDSFTGEIGEFVAARTLGLELLGRSSAANDATRAGLGYQIKSVARDGRTASIPLTRLVPGWDVLVVVVSLDRAFGCSGMWTMPLRSVVNPKSANMTNIMRTPGIVRVS